MYLWNPSAKASKPRWHQTWWGILALMVAAGIVVAVFSRLL